MVITLVGGDKRMQTAYALLKRNFFVNSISLFENDGADLSKSDVILLPVPTTRDGVFVNCPLYDKVPLSAIKAVKGNPLILTAGYDFKLPRQIDYAALDSFCIKNAVATAEGAIAAVISATDTTLFDSKILITGFGRIGKVLTARLKPFCKNLTVSARKQRDFAILDALYVNRIDTAAAAEKARDYDIIINTVDVLLFDDFSAFKSTYLFDLSSKGCLDYNKINSDEYKIKKLPGLPGKTAPVSAGKIISQTVTDIIKGEFQ